METHCSASRALPFLFLSRTLRLNVKQTALRCSTPESAASCTLGAMLNQTPQTTRQGLIISLSPDEQDSNETHHRPETQPNEGKQMLPAGAGQQTVTSSTDPCRLQQHASEPEARSVPSYRDTAFGAMQSVALAVNIPEAFKTPWRPSVSRLNSGAELTAQNMASAPKLD